MKLGGGERMGKQTALRECRAKLCIIAGPLPAKHKAIEVLRAAHSVVERLDRHEAHGVI